ncbi:OmpH family outer membrane protein [Hanstruepera ponticola]|uniref:OmpH family outer membrane protein n=1 Tax=Hanstruepera ponticola TaxID=2042995 RepID=UPI001F3AE2C8|nr:OmpH family outer membrane protein [Hanstruepera ponticola]
MKQMKLKVLFLVTAMFMLSLSSFAQRGVRIGYIDTEYILENVPEYQEATLQLENKVQKWKSEIETQLSSIEQKRKDLSNEKALLTKELIEEREEDIAFEEKEILDYQQKRFGPNGDLMIQKKQLIQPIQDQIFAAVQDIADKQKYDFVFDKSADVVMLYSAKRFDFSEQVIRSITRSAKRKQAGSKAERKAAEEEDVVIEVNEELEAKQAADDERKQAVLDEREARKQAAQKRRDSIIEARNAAREAKLRERNQETVDDIQSESENVSDGEASADEETKTPEQIAEERRQAKIADRERRKQELEARKQQILEERQRAKEERENQNNNTQETDDDGGDDN